jgi:L-fuconolactonase
VTRAANGLPANSIDSHVHFWDPGRPDWYPYLAPSFDLSSIGVSHGRDVRRVYGLDEHLANTVPAGIRATVHINATGTPDAFLPEMERVSAIAESTTALCAIQGKVDLTASPREIVALLDEYQTFPLFRGVRLLRVPDFSVGEVRTVLDWLVEHRRTLDLGVHPHEMAGAIELLQHYPALDVVVEHAGWPRPADLDDDRLWREGMAALAALGPQVRCKISGLSMALNSVDPERLRPWITRPLELFGSDRCMFGSNFPVDQGVAGYADVLEAHLAVLRGAGPRVVEDVFVNTAARFYGLVAADSSGAARESEV